MKFQRKLLHILVCLSFINVIVCSGEPKVLNDAEIKDLLTSRRRCGDTLNTSIDNVCLATVGQITSIRNKMNQRYTRSTSEYYSEFYIIRNINVLLFYLQFMTFLTTIRMQLNMILKELMRMTTTFSIVKCLKGSVEIL